IIDFTDAPTQRLATDANANPIALDSSQGRVIITGPTAARVSVGGRVLSPTGIAVNRARILVTMPSGEVRLAITNAFGYYRFDEIEVGETYVFTVEHKQYTFNPQVLNITDAVENLDFTALGEM
ncbi:MAG TPA: carboxypeptidase-like regulatory domain-containing protein, partial [Pyrinomonadaceae bacterium]|nr:carboxypeptidase-like regulatory domain-containing protein [Pyrinomonadaceae bacterium]